MESTNTRHVILIGDSGTGKTAMIYRQTKGLFTTDPPTIGLDCVSDKHSTSLLGFRKDKFNIRLWDTAGTEKYNTLSKSFFKKGDAIILCFDITNMLSFHNLVNWRDQIEANAQEEVPVVLVGTKSDLDTQRTVSNAVANKYADEHNMYYLECSSLDG